MINGEKSTFAIECEIHHTFENFIYCNFRFWIAGEQIGDWSEESVLGVLIHSAKVFARYQGERYLEQAEGMSAMSLRNYIDRITTSDDPNDMQVSIEGHYRQRFLLHEIADDSVARDFEVMVVERADGAQRVLSKRRDGDDLQEKTLPKLTVDKAVAEFLLWAEQQA
ncbi:MAG: hypothetical protein A3I66_00045 [Burkholderiales bacterium RIFCSPLOWO2_02_FULL_57_36]|nr:MAG: hypothetical protein A3I66_00045 [Burkholderiales bacterium RIFCSPLOWO2_02_FULL_57_36]